MVTGKVLGFMKQYGKENLKILKKRNILAIFADNITSAGGTCVFLYNMLSHMDCQAFCMHIYAPGKAVSKQMTDEFIKLGAVIYTGGWEEGKPVREIVWNDLEYLTSLHRYDVIHANTSKVWINYFACYFGVKNNIPKRIVHSHNALLPRIKPEVQKQDDIYREYILKNATDFLACSVKAAKWLYGLQFRDYTIINNGIDLENYKYNKDIRIRYRKELGIEDKFVIGHVGRFVKQKNHTFLIDIFKEITICNENSILLMAGDGELFEEIKYKAEVYGLKDKCMFLGIREDVPELLQAMDIFVFPSLFEGLGIVLVEAQANGLPCVVSDEIPREAFLTDEITKISLKSNAKYWAEQIMRYKGLNRNRVSNVTQLKTAGYDAQDVADYLYKLYIKYK